MKPVAFNKIFLTLLILLLVWGFIVFLSVSLIKIDEPLSFSILIVKQLGSIIIGLSFIVFIIFFKKFTYRYLLFSSFPIYVGALIISTLVFVPGLGIEVNGANRWVDIGITNLQPSEFLKIASIMFFSALLAQYGKRMKVFSTLLISLSLTFLIPCAILFLANDLGTILVILIAALAMLAKSSARIIHVVPLVLLSIVLSVSAVYVLKPYAWERIAAYYTSEEDLLGRNFQINQSLIAIGSGEVFGRGYGQSLQKFAYLPEPMTDSIFAIMAEEFGFIVTSLFLLVYLLFIIRGYHIAGKARDEFGQYLVIGIMTLIGSQFVVNIATMTKLFPLSGDPLIFVSQGGSVMVASLIATGLVLSVSRFTGKKL